MCGCIIIILPLVWGTWGDGHFGVKVRDTSATAATMDEPERRREGGREGGVEVGREGEKKE